MKHSLQTALFLFAAALLWAGAASAQSMGPGMMGPEGWGGYGPPQGQGWFCPYCGSWHGEGGRGYGRGPGMMGPGSGYGRGSGMTGQGPGMMQRWGRGGYGRMHRGWPQDQQYAPGRGPGYGYHRPDEPLNREEARQTLERYLETSRNPNLKIGDITEKDGTFEAEIVTRKAGDLVDRVQIDRRTGWMRSVYD